MVLRDVQGCLQNSRQLSENTDIIKKIKQTNENKRQRIQVELGMNYNPLSPFSSSIVGVGSSCQVLPTRETKTLNSLLKPIEKHEVDYALESIL